MKNLLIIQQNDFSGNHCVLMLTNSSQVIPKYVFQPHILVHMLNIATCRTCPGLPYWMTHSAGPGGGGGYVSSEEAVTALENLRTI